MIELKEISRRRKQLNLKQTELAKLAGVSQSALAKIESGRMNPSFEIAKKIFDALDALEHKEAIKAVDIMTKRIVEVDSNETVEHAIGLLKQHSISQIPVAARGRIIGLFSESDLLEHIGEKHFGQKKIKDVMSETPPQIPEDTPVRTVSELLKFSPIVVVTRKGETIGIIAKADLLKVVK